MHIQIHDDVKVMNLALALAAGNLQLTTKNGQTIVQELPLSKNQADLANLGDDQLIGAVARVGGLRMPEVLELARRFEALAQWVAVIDAELAELNASGPDPIETAIAAVEKARAEFRAREFSTQAGM